MILGENCEIQFLATSQLDFKREFDCFWDRTCLFVVRVIDLISGESFEIQLFAMFETDFKGGSIDFEMKSVFSNQKLKQSNA